MRIAHLLWLWLWLLPAVASAHRFAPGLLSFSEQTPGVFSVRFSPPSLPERTGALRPMLPAHCRPSTSGSPLPAQIHCGPAGLAGARLGLSGAGPGAPAEVVVVVHLLDGSTLSAVLRGAGAELTLPGAGRTSALLTLRSYLRLGFVHILSGWDHLLLLLGLLLLVPSVGALFITLSAFTAAHSLTLALSALSVLRLPSAPVEVLIAASIALLAAEVLRPGPKTLLGRRPAVGAFLLGLLHGLGFAGALGEVGLPAGQVPLALLSFNLGVEGGQLAFVLFLWLPAKALRRGAARLLSAYAMGALSLCLALDRLLQMGSP